MLRSCDEPLVYLSFLTGIALQRNSLSPTGDVSIRRTFHRIRLDYNPTQVKEIRCPQRLEGFAVARYATGGTE